MSEITLGSYDSSVYKNPKQRMQDPNFFKKYNKDDVASFGVSFLDDSMIGILKDDLILLGSYSGSGKTQFCVNCALENVKRGKRVHMIALEATKNEVEHRMQYELLANCYFRDPTRKRIDGNLRMLRWAFGDYEDQFATYNEYVHKILEAYSNFFTYYKTDSFGLDEMIENIISIHGQTDLILIDHVHYFDLDDDNENRALKTIAKTVRDLCQRMETPILLVAHLRKKDKRTLEIVPGLDEFHGSSDLTKIATKVITMARGDSISGNRLFQTNFRIPKCRIDGSLTQYIGTMFFDLSTNTYRQEYLLNKLSGCGQKMEPIELNLPDWYKGSCDVAK